MRKQGKITPSHVYCLAVSQSTSCYILLQAINIILHSSSANQHHATPFFRQSTSFYILLQPINTMATSFFSQSTSGSIMTIYISVPQTFNSDDPVKKIDMRRDPLNPCTSPIYSAAFGRIRHTSTTCPSYVIEDFRPLNLT